MKIAIITGASSGLGREFAAKIRSAVDVECVWLIARRKARLDEISASLGINVESIALDLTSDTDLDILSRKLADEKPQVEMLINCAGCGYLGDVADNDPAFISRMIDLNVRGMSLVANIVLPYITSGGHIINISSIASFCPNARMTVYSATKAYVSSFSLGLREELRSRKISVTAVCPGPMDTEFLDIGGITGNSKMFKTLPYCIVEKVVAGAYKAAKRDRAFYTPKLFFKFYRFLAKIIPHTLLVKLVKT